jgi:hypothetical protein
VSNIEARFDVDGPHDPDRIAQAVEAAPPATPEQKALIRDLMPPVPADRWSCPSDPEPPPVT